MAEVYMVTRFRVMAEGECVGYAHATTREAAERQVQGHYDHPVTLEAEDAAPHEVGEMSDEMRASWGIPPRSH